MDTGLGINVPSFQNVSADILSDFCNDLSKALTLWAMSSEIGYEYVTTPGFTKAEQTAIFEDAKRLLLNLPADRNPRFYPVISLAKGNCEGYRVEIGIRYFPDNASINAFIGFECASVKCWSVEEQVAIYQYVSSILLW